MSESSLEGLEGICSECQGRAPIHFSRSAGVLIARHNPFGVGCCEGEGLYPEVIVKIKEKGAPASAIEIVTTGVSPTKFTNNPFARLLKNVSV